MNVVWATPAIELATQMLDYTEQEFGLHQRQKLKSIFATIAQDIAFMPQRGPLEPALVKSGYESRYILIFKRIKVVYQLLDDDHAVIVAVCTTYQSGESLRKIVEREE